MHASPPPVDGPVSRRRAWRAARALLCIGVVLLAHGALWIAVSSADRPTASRVVAVQVRHVVVPVAQADAPAAAVAAAPLAPGRAQRPSRAAERARVAPRVEPAREAEPTPGTPVTTGVESHEPAAPAAPSAATPLPTYPTRIPPSALLTYTLRRGSATGEAIVHWRVEGERYLLSMRAALSVGRPVERQSQGGFDQAGLAPLRLADRRAGRDVRAANFQRDRGLITFSGPRWEWPLHGGAQDRLSWLVQLVAIASADVLREGMALSMWVAGTRGALSAWRFEVRGREQMGAPGGETSAWWLVREPEHPYDVRVEVWLDPSRGNWPLRLRQTQIPGGEPLEWQLRDEPQPAQGTSGTGAHLESGFPARS